MTARADLPPRRPRRKDKLANGIAQSVLQDIKRRGLSEGDQLPKEAVMLEEYAVGRGTLREAMRVLETCGLISLKPGPGGGPVVEAVRAEDFGRVASLFFQFAGVTYREVIEARLILEPVAARIAAQQQADTPAAHELLQLTQQVAAPADDEVFLHAANDFHASLAELCGNQLLTLVCQSLGEIYRARVRGGLFPKSRQRDVHTAHADVAKAIIAGDGELAERLMAEHMDQFCRAVARRHPALLNEVVAWR